jgi:hypothetical protein
MNPYKYEAIEEQKCSVKSSGISFLSMITGFVVYVFVCIVLNQLLIDIGVADEKDVLLELLVRKILEYKNSFRAF